MEILEKDTKVILMEPIIIDWEGRKARIKYDTLGELVEDAGKEQLLINFGSVIGKQKISKDVIKKI